MKVAPRGRTIRLRGEGPAGRYGEQSNYARKPGEGRHDLAIRRLWVFESIEVGANAWPSPYGNWAITFRPAGPETTSPDHFLPAVFSLFCFGFLLFLSFF